MIPFHSQTRLPHDTHAKDCFDKRTSWIGSFGAMGWHGELRCNPNCVEVHTRIAAARGQHVFLTTSSANRLHAKRQKEVIAKMDASILRFPLSSGTDGSPPCSSSKAGLSARGLRATIWRREGLKVPKKQKPRGHSWLNDGSCARLYAERPNHVWSNDFVSTKTHDGRSVRLLTLVDEDIA